MTGIGTSASGMPSGTGTLAVATEYARRATPAFLPTLPSGASVNRHGELRANGGRHGAAVWSTRDLPAREQFAFWRELVCRHAKAITYDRDVPSVTPFTGELVLRPLGTARVLELYAEGRRRVSRRGRSRVREPACHIYQQRSGTFRYRFGGRELVARPGDVMVAAPDAVFEGEALGDSSLRVWALPPSRLLARLAARALPLLHIPAADGTGGLVGTLADALARQADHLDLAAAEACLDSLCALVGIAAGAAAAAVAGGREAVRAARLERAKRHIERHLAEPDLSPAAVARAAGVSERQLQLLFEREGETFTRYLTRRRLEEVRAALARPDAGPVTELALAWGFGSLPTFYRAFRHAYGAAPGELRAVAC